VVQFLDWSLLSAILCKYSDMVMKDAGHAYESKTIIRI
jgi:hypothetical protein